MISGGILITGGTGFFGQAFVAHLLKQEDYVSRIVVFSRSEHRQFQMAQAFKELDPRNKLRFFIGDVRDRDRLHRAMRGIDYVVHAAALKRIEVGHYNPTELVKTNILGSMNVVEAAQDAGVKKVLALSTDKAYAPVSPYGASKAMMEGLFLAANNTSGWNGPRFAVCRYGNIFGATGSVVPLWEEKKRQGITKVQVTDLDCTRFFMLDHEAVQLVVGALNAMPNKVVVPTLAAYRVGDLVEAMGLTAEVVGLPPWEKKHESMEDNNSSDLARRMSVVELKRALEERALLNQGLPQQESL